jgi:hypothetical protein
MEKIEKEGRIRNFNRYGDGSKGIWKGRKEDLEVKVMKVREKEIRLKLGIEEKGKITFLDIEIGRG